MTPRARASLAHYIANRATEPFTLRIPRELKSPNKWQGRHWRYKHRETTEWEQAIHVAYAMRRGVMVATQSRIAGVLGASAPLKAKVTVTRIVPSARNFIRDDDNLRFSTKPLNDALKRLGLIHDDSRRWLEQPQVRQEVSGIGEWATVITIEPVEAATAVPEAS